MQKNPQKIQLKIKKTMRFKKNPTNTRGEKYNLRPNPNPNFSDSYRY